MQSMTRMNGNPNIKSMIKDARTKSANNVLHLLVIKDKKSYQTALTVMEYLMLNAPDTVHNPYHDFMVLLGRAIEAYEEEHYPIPRVSALEVLRFFMEQQGLKQVDLVPVLGTASIVSEILSAKRELNKRHIESLSKYFHVSPAVFF